MSAADGIETCFSSPAMAGGDRSGAASSHLTSSAIGREDDSETEVGAVVARRNHWMDIPDRANAVAPPSPGGGEMATVAGQERRGRGHGPTGYRRGRGGMVDAGDLKSPGPCPCGFESRRPHQVVCTIGVAPREAPPARLSRRGRSSPRRSCNNACRSGAGRRRTHGPDGRRNRRNGPRCGGCRG